MSLANMRGVKPLETLEKESEIKDIQLIEEAEIASACKEARGYVLGL